MNSLLSCCDLIIYTIIVKTSVIFTNLQLNSFRIFTSTHNHLVLVMKTSTDLKIQESMTKQFYTIYFTSMFFIAFCYEKNTIMKLPVCVSVSNIFPEPLDGL